MGKTKEFAITFKDTGPLRGKYIIIKADSIRKLHQIVQESENKEYDKVYSIAALKKYKQYKLFE